MSDNLERIEDAVATLLGGGATERDVIINTVKMIASTPQYAGEITEDHILKIAKKLETRFDISMDIGSILEADDYTPWLDDNRGDIDWYYWKRYKRLLPDKKFAPDVISKLDLVTDKIIEHLENPKKLGQWKRKGLVVGHVQSGKTANYTGVICKAADSGYKVIIVLAGLSNALRNQTQERIDEGFVGIDSARRLNTTGLREILVGVGKISEISILRTPVSLTTNTQDFDNGIANRLRTRIGHFNEPVILVLKKNVSILKNLIDWLRNNNLDLHGFPMLLIDDEADHASVNTRKEDEDPVATNSRIRELLSLFEKNSYLGYTATPFANIFINPDSKDEMLSDDLFPKDFIISLDTPSNYVGAKRIFEQDGDLDIVREINDHEDILPLRHKKNEPPEMLPASLKEAIRTFILVKAARNLRRQKNSHNSMLVNVSRFTNIQSHIKLLVHDYLTELRDAITNHYALPVDALKNSGLLSLKTTWDTEFGETEFSWNAIQKELKNAVSPIGVIEINRSRNSSPLDYNRRDYPNGRNVIAVGGFSLSRGLTLEGLTVSYFLRNSIMYDTLMQMGRWFGYRTDFEELCRIYMTEEASSWYAHISRATEELREEFSRMEKAKMTPNDFGLCVRSHPETLIVTARNKMRSGQSVTRQVSLEGRLVETSVLLKTSDVITNNHKALERLIQKASDTDSGTTVQQGYLHKNIPVSPTKDFLRSFINHPASQLTESKPIIDYAEWLESKGTNTWDIILISLSKNADNNLEIDVMDKHIISEQRKVSDYPGNGIELNKRRLASRGHEQAGLTDEEIKTAKIEYMKDYPGKKNFPDSIYRAKRKKPLLMLHVLDCRKNTNTVFPGGVIAYGISFPGEAGSRRPEKLVEYIVTTGWWRNNYADLLDEDEGGDFDK